MSAKSVYPHHKELKRVIQQAVKSGLWVYAPMGGSHGVGQLRCAPVDFTGDAEDRRELCRVTCYSTPEPPERWAREWLRKIAKCPHGCALGSKGRPLDG